MDVTKSTPSSQKIPVLCLVVAVAAVASSVILWYQNVALARDLEETQKSVLEMWQQLKMIQKIQVHYLLCFYMYGMLSAVINI